MIYSDAIQHCIFRYRAGSWAYGTNSPDSDEDYRGVFVAPLRQAFDLFHTSFVGSEATLGGWLSKVKDAVEMGDKDVALEYLRNAMLPDQGDLQFSVQTVQRPGHDEELHELRKFLSLAAACNPNIIEFLYVEPPILITHETEVWRTIKAHRHFFLSKRAKHTFSGYSIAQLKRIQRHRSYLLNPPTHQPTRAEFGLPEETTVAREHHKALLSLPLEWVKDEARDIVRREKQYATAKEAWCSYQNWERERNPARREMERRFGYDGKHAAHLIRLIRMAKEILTEGIVRVYRPDHEELLAIRHGAWTYEQVVAYAEEADRELDSLYEASPLRHQPDYKGIAKLYREICEEHYGITI